MSHSNNQRAALDAVLSRIELDCTDAQKEKILGHLKLVIDKNKVLNLTRIDSIEDALVLHVEDSLSVYRDFSQRDGSFCDIGTGGGFPGIPLGIVSGRSGALLDSVKKKARAVQGFIEDLELENLNAFPLRSEEFAKENMNQFDTVIARAVSSLNVVEELAAPLLRFKGQLVAMKGIESSEDEKIALKASEDLGLELVSKRIFTIGGSAYKRSVYVFEKVDDSAIKLPRRPGMATKRPLGLK